MGLALVTLVISDDTEPISVICQRKVGQIICSTHYYDQLLECLQGLTEESFFRKSGTEVCLRPVPEFCATAEQCAPAETSHINEQPPTVKPQASESISN